MSKFEEALQKLTEAVNDLADEQPEKNKPEIKVGAKVTDAEAQGWEVTSITDTKVTLKNENSGETITMSVDELIKDFAKGITEADELDESAKKVYEEMSDDEKKEYDEMDDDEKKEKYMEKMKKKYKM